MLRALFALLVLANLGYFLWARGDLAAFGSVPESMTQREPHRLAQQVRPEALKLHPDAAPAR